MFKITGKEIGITRGDSGTITLKVPLNTTPQTYYQFEANDIITFGVYNKKGLQDDALILKEIVVSEQTETINISLTSDDTTILLIENKPIECWYEIQLNHEQTLIGYDDDGAKTFTLYPEGSDAI